jgi:ubiquinone/menaquinone biosynthesis C-methylase UbiE
MRFQAQVTHWKEVYQLKTLDAVLYRQRRDTILSLVEALEIPSEAHILEIGCGAGLTTVALAKLGHLIEAIDTVEAMLDLTRRGASEAGVGDQVTTSRQDAHHLNFADDRFDLILGVGVAPWLHSLSRAIREMVRVLKPEGHLILTTDNCWSLRLVLDPLSFPPLRHLRREVRNGLERCGLRTPAARLHLYSPKEFDSVLGEAGLDKERGITIGFGPFTFLGHGIIPDSVGLKIHCKLQELADRGLPILRSSGLEYIVHARKFGGGHKEIKFQGGHGEKLKSWRQAA